MGIQVNEQPSETTILSRGPDSSRGSGRGIVRYMVCNQRKLMVLMVVVAAARIHSSAVDYDVAFTTCTISELANPPANRIRLWDS